MERGVKPPDFGYHVDFARIIVPALDGEHEGVHLVAQPPPGGQLVRRVQVQEMTEIAALHFRAAELVHD